MRSRTAHFLLFAQLPFKIGGYWHCPPAHPYSSSVKIPTWLCVEESMGVEAQNHSGFRAAWAQP